MKAKITVAFAAIFAIAMMACNNTDYKKTKSGLAYKLFTGGSKDSVIKAGNIVKFHFTRKLNDSVLYTSFGKMPNYLPMQNDPGMSYSPIEVFFMARKGDSIVTVEMVDTLLTKPAASQLPPGAKKGDRMVTMIKIIEVFTSDSLARPDYDAEIVKDRPRQEKEMKEMQAKEAAAMKEQMQKEYEELKKTGQIEKQEKEILDYLAKKNITTATKTGGTYVVVKEKGNGEPALNDKFIHVKYAGRALATDSVFQANEYIFPLGQSAVIKGWDEGIAAFNKGGKGTLYIPGYLAYGQQPGPVGKPYSALIFEVEILNVTDTKEKAEDDKRIADSILAAKPVKK